MKQIRNRILGLTLALALILSCCPCMMVFADDAAGNVNPVINNDDNVDPVTYVSGLIDAIGTVEYTEECKAKINTARSEYSALTPEQKSQIVNYNLLEQAEIAYAELKAAADKETADKAAAADVVSLISEIGTVEYTDECKAKINAARSLYSELLEDQKVYVINYDVLEAAEATYATRKAEANKAITDQAAADEVIALINAIGEVAYSDESKAKLDAARALYGELTDDQKALVTNYDALTGGETKYAELKAAEIKAQEDRAAAQKVTDMINALGTPEDTDAYRQAVSDARSAYTDLTQDQKALVTAEILDELKAAEKAVKDFDAGTIAEQRKTAKAALYKGVIVKQKGKKYIVKWSKVKVADGYDVYAGYCGFYDPTLFKTIKKNTVTKVKIAKLDGKKLDLDKNIKVYVVAYKYIDGKKVTLAKSVVSHAIGNKNAQYTNPKSLKLNKSKATLEVGFQTKVKAKVTREYNNKKLLPVKHIAKLRYKTSNKKVATVSKNGKIKGVGKGKCTVYVIAANGITKKVKVTVQ